MQRQMEEQQKEMETREYSAVVGGGAVEATVSGAKVLTKIKISEEAVDPEDVETLEDLVLAAVNEALKQAEDASQEMMRGISGGLNLPF